MAITSVVEQRSHTYRFSGESGQPLPAQDLERRFWVYSDTNDENPNSVRLASGIPTYGAAHPSISAAIVAAYDISRNEDYPKRWDVRVAYASRRLTGSNTSGDADQDPETITKIRVSTVQGEKIVERDINGFAPQTTAGELITNLKIPWNELQLEFTQYRSVLDTASYVQLATYRNAVNSDTWRGFAPLTARISSIEGQDVQIQGDTYLERKITVLLRDPDDDQSPDWRLKFLNAGYYYKQTFAMGGDYDPVTGPTMTSRLARIYDRETGNPCTRPLPLDSSGQYLADPENPYWLNIEVYPALPFAALNI